MAFDSINAVFSFESRFKSVLRSFSFVSENLGSNQDRVHYIPKQEYFCGLRWNWHEHEFPASRRWVVSVPSSAYKALIHKIEEEKFEYNALFIGVQYIYKSSLISFFNSLEARPFVGKVKPTVSVRQFKRVRCNISLCLGNGEWQVKRGWSNCHDNTDQSSRICRGQ